MLPDVAKPLPEPMLTNHQWGHAAFTLRAISQEMIKICILDINFKIINLKWQPPLPGDNELTSFGHWWPIINRMSHGSETSQWVQSTMSNQPVNCGTGPRFTNGFSIAIQIRWKFRFALISIVIQWWQQNFVHGTTAVLSWHVQRFVAIWWPTKECQ